MAYSLQTRRTLLLVMGLLQCLGWTVCYMNISFLDSFDSLDFYLYNPATIFTLVSVHNKAFQVSV